MWTWKNVLPAANVRRNVPKKVDSEYDAATGKRKAIYVKYAQAVPLKYQIDAENCIRFKKAGACGFCEKVCPADAINFDDTEKMHEINVGAVVLAPGFEAFDPAKAGVWGFGRIQTSLPRCSLSGFFLPRVRPRGIWFGRRTARRSPKSPSCNASVPGMRTNAGTAIVLQSAACMPSRKR